jgi:two-component system response regulator (stage 0 sporulation protein A)
MENVNVVIVDDNPMILNTLDEMISSEAGLSVIGRADNGKDAIDMIKDTEPDVTGSGHAESRWYYCG